MYVECAMETKVELGTSFLKLIFAPVFKSFKCTFYTPQPLRQFCNLLILKCYFNGESKSVLIEDNDNRDVFYFIRKVLLSLMICLISILQPKGNKISLVQILVDTFRPPKASKSRHPTPPTLKPRTTSNPRGTT